MRETRMSFDVGHTTFGFTMRVPDADVGRAGVRDAQHQPARRRRRRLVTRARSVIELFSCENRLLW